MHGIMFWKQGQAWSWNGSDEETAQVSKLVGLGPQGRKNGQGLNRVGLTLKINVLSKPE
jgi:hypothetical protein